MYMASAKAHLTATVPTIPINNHHPTDQLTTNQSMMATVDFSKALPSLSSKTNCVWLKKTRFFSFLAWEQ